MSYKTINHWFTTKIPQYLFRLDPIENSVTIMGYTLLQAEELMMLSFSKTEL